MCGPDGTARRDAVLTLLVLVPLAAAAVVRSAPVTPPVVALGVGSTLAAEFLLSLHAARVRALWADRRIRVLAVVVALGGGGTLAIVAGPWVLTASVSALCTYLAVLAASVWWHRTSDSD